MKEPEEQSMPPTAEVDYLKKVRRRTSRVGMVCGIVMMAVGMLLLFARVFLIGSAADATDASFTISVAESTVYVSGKPRQQLGGHGTYHVRGKRRDRQCQNLHRSPFLCITEFFSAEYTAHSDIVGMVRCGDLILWENGVQISSTAASQLFAAANPFAGDMPSNTRIATIPGVYAQFGSYTSELQTRRSPTDGRFAPIPESMRMRRARRGIS